MSVNRGRGGEWDREPHPAISMRPLLLAAVLPLAACGLDSSEPSADPAPETVRAEPSAPIRDGSTEAGRPIAPGARPERAAGTIEVEGQQESVDLRLVTFPGFALPFETYVPGGWTTDTIAAGEGASVILASSDATPRGIVSLFVPADGSLGSALATAREIAQQRGGVRTPQAPEWAAEMLAFQGDGYAGTVAVGEHGGTAFLVLTERPVEMGDGFTARAALVLDRLRWSDDGTAL